jgi:hypothetical protein
MQTSSLSLQPHASRSSITMPYPSHLITPIAHSQIKHTIIQADVKPPHPPIHPYNIDTTPRQKEDHHEVDSSFDAHRLSTLCRYPVSSIFSSGLRKTASQLLSEECAHLVSLVIPVTLSRSYVPPIELLFGNNKRRGDEMGGVSSSLPDVTRYTDRVFQSKAYIPRRFEIGYIHTTSWSVQG